MKILKQFPYLRYISLILGFWMLLTGFSQAEIKCEQVRFPQNPLPLQSLANQKKREQQLMTAIDQENYNEAIELASQILSYTPSRQDILELRALIYFTKEWYCEAIGDLSVLLKNPIDRENQTRLAQYSYLRAYSYWQQEQFNKALVDIHTAQKWAPKKSSYYQLGAQIFLSLQRLPEAQSAIEKSLQLDLKNLKSYEIRADIYRAKKNWRAALKNYNHIITTQPQAAEVLIKRGKTLFALGQLALARKDAQRAREITSFYNAEALLLEAEIAEKEKSPHEARELKKQAYQYLIENSSQSLEETLLKAEKEVGLLQDKAWIPILEEQSNNTEFHQHETHFLLLKHLIALNPSEPRYYRERASHWSEEGEQEKALIDLNKALKLSPNDPDTLHELGHQLLLLSRYEDALEKFKQAIPLKQWTDLSSYSPYRGCIDTLKSLERYADAVFYLNQVMEKEPPSYLDYQERADLWVHLKEYSKALADYNQALEIRKTKNIGHLSHVYFYRGQLYRHMQEDEKALSDFNAVLEEVAEEVPEEKKDLFIGHLYRFKAWQLKADIYKQRQADNELETLLSGIKAEQQLNPEEQIQAYIHVLQLLEHPEEAVAFLSQNIKIADFQAAKTQDTYTKYNWQKLQSYCLNERSILYKMLGNLAQASQDEEQSKLIQFNAEKMLDKYFKRI